MTPERFREIRRALQWSNGGLGHLLGYSDERRIRRWAQGARPVPEAVAAWLEGLMGYLDEHPPPRYRAPTFADQETEC